MTRRSVPRTPRSDARRTGPTVRIVDAEVDGRRVDVEWSDGVVTAVSPPGSASTRTSVRAGADDVEIDAGGGALIPGLHDHHIHLMALAAARASVDVGPRRAAGPAALARLLTAACARRTGDEWVRGVGYHDAVAGALDADALDELVPAAREVPIRLQHRSGQLWILNRRAVAAIRLHEIRDPGVERDGDDVPTGRVFGLDDELAGRIPHPRLDLAATMQHLAACGVTGVTDLTPSARSAPIETLAAAAARPDNPVRVTITGAVELPASAGRGLPRGPVKILPADHATVDFDQLAATIRAAHGIDRNVAIHAVSRVGAAVAVAAWNEVGVRAGDRLEHGAVLDAALMEAIGELALIVVTQPNFVAERGDEYLAEVDDDDLEHLWRCASLDAAGIAVAGGTDAPFGDPDPWRAINAAVERRTPTGVVLGAEERVSARRALELFGGTAGAPLERRTVRVGAWIDLCLLDRPLVDALDAPTSRAVVATVGRAGFLPACRSDNDSGAAIAEAEV